MDFDHEDAVGRRIAAFPSASQTSRRTICISLINRSTRCWAGQGNGARAGDGDVRLL